MKIKAFIFAIILTFPVLANALTPEQKSQINKKISQFELAVQKNDFDTIFKLMPIPLMQTLATSKHMTLAEFQEDATKYAREYKEKSLSQKPEINLDSAIDGHTLKRPYTLFTATIYMDIQGNPYPLPSPQLAFMDKGEWYIIDIGNPNMLEAIQKTYPDLKDLSIPAEFR